jgi:protein-L-isoaspartate(D-aspartate) O-methyltransferase
MNLEFARQQMIEQQVHTWEVFDERILNVMREVPREAFVPAAYQSVAFADSMIPLDQGQWMLPPKVHGRILQTLEPPVDDVALEIGSGSGYLTACLARLCARVRSLEIVPSLAELARRQVLSVAANNAAIETADGMQLDESARYDVIAVTGSLPIYDERFQRALKIGGRLFIVVGPSPAMEAWKVTRLGEREWQRESLFETVIAPLANAPRPSAFVF